MRHIPETPLWIGHVGDARDRSKVLQAGIAAMVDLAINEPPVATNRDMIYCRFPLIEGSNNPHWLLQPARVRLARLLQNEVPTLVFCSAGLSRSPCIAAAVLSLHTGKPPAATLSQVLPEVGADISPQMWFDVQQALSELVRMGNSGGTV